MSTNEEEDRAAPSGTDVQEQISSLAKRKATTQTHRGQDSLVPAAKLAKNRRLPATMITPGGKIEASKKVNAKGRPETRKKKRASESAKEKALERMERMQVKAKASEERKAKRQRAKSAWE